MREGRGSSRSAECKCVWMSAWWNNLVRRPLIRDIVRMAGNRNQPVPPRVFSLRSRITPETGNSLPPCPVYSFNRSTLDFCQYLVGTRAYRRRSRRFREIPTIDRTLASLNIYQGPRLQDDECFDRRYSSISSSWISLLRTQRQMKVQMDTLWILIAFVVKVFYHIGDSHQCVL